MSKHHLFIVHGMGAHPEGQWHTEIVQTLRAVYQQYEPLNEMPFDDRIEIVPVSYDRHFESLRQNWKNSEALLGQLNGSGTGEVLQKQVLEWADLGIDDSFFWTHVMDVVLYRLFDLVRVPVEQTIAKTIADTLQDNGSPPWSILAHSLGTSVIHGTLYRAYSDDQYGLNPRAVRPRVIMMVANVSRLYSMSRRFTIPTSDRELHRTAAGVVGIIP